MFLGLTGGRARGYGLVEAYMDAEDEADEVARRESENGVCTGVGWAYRGVAACTVGHWEA
jgi:hypothetical protein